MTELDPELKGRVLEFVWDKRWVTHGRIAREFFSGDGDAAGRYLDQLAAEGEISGVAKHNGQVSWLPVAEATTGPVIPVKWAQYADGKTYTLTEDEIREKYGISIPQFRRRLVFASVSYSGVSSGVESAAVWFRIEGVKKASAKKSRKRSVSHAHCDHPITRTDRLACEKRM